MDLGGTATGSLVRSSKPMTWQVGQPLPFTSAGDARVPIQRRPGTGPFWSVQRLQATSRDACLPRFKNRAQRADGPASLGYPSFFVPLRVSVHVVHSGGLRYNPPLTERQ